jgi:hypothetical protein
MVYGVHLGDLNDEQKRRLEALINEELVKRGIADRATVVVSETAAVLSFVPTWDTELSDAVAAGIELFRAEE